MAGTGIVYLEMLENWLWPQLLQDIPQVLIFQQCGTNITWQHHDD